MKALIVGDPHFHHRTPISRIDDYSHAVIRKVDFLFRYAEEHQITSIFLLGDVFHTVSQPVWYLNEVIQSFSQAKESGINVYTLIGNHDVPYGRLDQVSRTPLGTLIASSCLSLLNNPVTLGKYTIWGEHYGEKASSATLKHQILLSHRFFNSGHDQDNMSVEEATQLRYMYYFMGHDHETYDPFLLQKGVVFRSGSLTRGTSHTHQTNRKLFVYELDGETGHVTTVSVPHPPASEVFTAESLLKYKTESQKSSKDFREELVTLLSRMHRMEGDSQVGDTLNHMTLQPTVRQRVEFYLRKAEVI